MLEYFRLIRPIVHLLPPETAHSLALYALRQASKFGLLSVHQERDDPILSSRLWGCEFGTPIGLAAGLDKNAKVVDEILSLGFAFVEIGAVTPHPQIGNEPPRLFRLIEDEALINRFGFPNEGLDKVAMRLQRRLKATSRRPGIVGANIATNADAENILTDDRIADDYVKCVKRLANLVDYLVINVSCPNTPGLRRLQEREPLASLVHRIVAARAAMSEDCKPPILLKIDPDLDDQKKKDIAEITMNSDIDGLIVSNTTLRRPDDLKSKNQDQKGGLSGRPLFALSTRVLGEMYRLTEGKVPLIGLGGVRSGHDAYTKIRAGASLVQLYTALVYEGPTLISRIKRELAQCLRQDGFSHVQHAVGADVPLRTDEERKKSKALAQSEVAIMQHDSIANALVS